MPHQFDLFTHPCTQDYRGWKPSALSAEAYAAEWELLHRGSTSLRIAAPLFRGAIDPWLRHITRMVK
jgi:hypothetical protein